MIPNNASMIWPRFLSRISNLESRNLLYCSGFPECCYLLFRISEAAQNSVRMLRQPGGRRFDVRRRLVEVCGQVEQLQIADSLGVNGFQSFAMQDLLLVQSLLQPKDRAGWNAAAIEQIDPVLRLLSL